MRTLPVVFRGRRDGDPGEKWWWVSVMDSTNMPPSPPDRRDRKSASSSGTERDGQRAFAKVGGVNDFLDAERVSAVVLASSAPSLSVHMVSSRGVGLIHREDGRR